MIKLLQKQNGAVFYASQCTVHSIATATLHDSAVAKKHLLHDSAVAKKHLDHILLRTSAYSASEVSRLCAI